MTATAGSAPEREQACSSSAEDSDAQDVSSNPGDEQRRSLPSTPGSAFLSDGSGIGGSGIRARTLSESSRECIVSERSDIREYPLSPKDDEQSETSEAMTRSIEVSCYPSFSASWCPYVPSYSTDASPPNDITSPNRI
ncbi:unnamed protein product [Amoebophrya sp. A25]|nr:unnamed protein product [Amoebophrya sp. A25]|eukprot:GSA25T00009110001.1